MHDSIAILDFGSQYAQLIARRVREVHVYCELFPWDAPEEKVLSLRPKGFILSGGPKSVYADDAPKLPAYLIDSKLPILGICYGMGLLAHALGGKVDPSAEREYGLATVEIVTPNTFLPQHSFIAWMSHGDRISCLPKGFVPIARSGNSPVAAMLDSERGYLGLQFHPEVRHTPDGTEILRSFVVDLCGAKPDWTPVSIIQDSVERIRSKVADERLIAAVSGGVDSSVAAALVNKAVADQLVAVFVNTGLLRQNEPEQVAAAFRKNLNMRLVVVDASAEFFSALRGVTDPEQKRRIVGEKFIRVFEAQVSRLGQPRFLVQGTIYPDVVESAATDRGKSAKIKTHHNVGGLPSDMRLELVEPLRNLFKDEVRLVGEALGLPRDLVWRQPFPGPGLTVRCLGEVTTERVAKLRLADNILLEELSAAGLLGEGAETAQAFAVLLPVRSVGVMGDERTYQETIAIRAVQSEDFMTADWVRLPNDLLARVSNRIVNEVNGINRVVYDITSKPPATIEWE